MNVIVRNILFIGSSRHGFRVKIMKVGNAGRGNHVNEKRHTNEQVFFCVIVSQRDNVYVIMLTNKIQQFLKLLL